MQLSLLLGLMLVSVLLDLAAVGSVIPFLAIAANQDTGFIPPEVMAAIGSFGLAPLHAAAALFASAILLSAIVRLLLSWANHAMGNKLAHELAMSVFGGILNRGYEDHKRESTAVLMVGLGKVEGVASTLVQPLLQGLVAALTLALLGCFVLYLDFALALLGGSLLTAAYLLLKRFSARRLEANSELVAVGGIEVGRARAEVMGGIREAMITNTIPSFLDRIRRLDLRNRTADANSYLIAVTPGIVLHALVQLSVIGIAVYLASTPGGLIERLPVLAGLALGAQRLMPQANTIWNSWTTIASNRRSIIDAAETLVRERRPSPAPVPPLESFGSLRLDNVSFEYRDGDRALVDVDLEIRRGEYIGIKGRTGSGKSTLLDLLLGLLEPTGGRILLDGEPLAGDLRTAWQGSLAAMTGGVFFFDASIAANIGFPWPAAEIDRARMIEAAKAAEIHDWIDSLPAGYDTPVREGGARLSAGQAQRIGLARAIYRRPRVLVLDEATSSLDAETEARVIANIEAVAGEMTIIAVSHRLHTLAHCDRVVEIDRGRLREVGHESPVLAG